MSEPTPTPQDPAATVALKGGLKIEAPRDTVKVEGANTPTLKLSGDGPEPKRLTWLPWALGLLLVGGTVAGVFWWLGRPTQPAPTLEAKLPAPAEKLPPEVEAKVREANQGDVHAMHALAIWYFYGINVPKDRERGLEWYRKAAAAGSDAARQELAQIEGR
jgi:hypothetical protein